MKKNESASLSHSVGPADPVAPRRVVELPFSGWDYPSESTNPEPPRVILEFQLKGPAEPVGEAAGVKLTSRALDS